MGEFGQKPRVSQITSSTGADKGGGRLAALLPVLLAAAGCRRAMSAPATALAAYPARTGRAADIAATIYRAVGLPAETEIRDPFDRPFALSTGTPIRALLG